MSLHLTVIMCTVLHRAPLYVLAAGLYPGLEPNLYKHLKQRIIIQTDLVLPSKKRTCKNMQESCKNLACKTCLARARDMSLFLHNLAQSCTNSCKPNLQVIILAASLAKSCTTSCKNRARLCKNCARFCKKRDISRARAKQVLHARFLQDSCMFLQVRFCWVCIWSSLPLFLATALSICRHVKLLWGHGCIRACRIHEAHDDFMSC